MPYLFTSLLVVGMMIVLILLSATFIGGEVAKGSLQVSLTLVTLFALFVAHFMAFATGLSLKP